MHEENAEEPLPLPQLLDENALLLGKKIPNKGKQFFANESQYIGYFLLYWAVLARRRARIILLFEDVNYKLKSTSELLLVSKDLLYVLF